MQVYKYRSALPKAKTLKRLPLKTISFSEDYLILKATFYSADISATIWR